MRSGSSRSDELCSRCTRPAFRRSRRDLQARGAGQASTNRDVARQCCFETRPEGAEPLLDGPDNPAHIGPIRPWGQGRSRRSGTCRPGRGSPIARATPQVGTRPADHDRRTADRDGQHQPAIVVGVVTEQLDAPGAVASVVGCPPKASPKAERVRSSRGEIMTQVGSQRLVRTAPIPARPASRSAWRS